MQKWFKGPRMLTGPGGLFAAVALIVALGACYPGDISSVEETDVVLTIHSGNDFSGFNTYAMPDTIVDVCTNVDDPECENAIDIDHSYDDQILAQVKEAYQRAEAQRLCGQLLGPLFQTALQVGKQVRTETDLTHIKIPDPVIGVPGRGK